MDYTTVPTTLPEGKTLDERDAQNTVDAFYPSVSYSEKSRNGVAVKAGVYRGNQVVSVGPAWHKDVFEDGSYFHAILKRGSMSISPDDADALADTLKAAAAKARKFDIPKEEPKAAKPKSSGKKGTQLDQIADMFQTAFASVDSRLTKLEQATGATPAAAAPAANSEVSTTAEADTTSDSEVQERVDALSDAKRNLFNELTAGGVDTESALGMVENATVQA